MAMEVRERADLVTLEVAKEIDGSDTADVIVATKKNADAG